MVRLNHAARLCQIAGGPFRAWRTWFHRHRRHYDALAPGLVCPVCGGRTRLTPELDARLTMDHVTCDLCGQGTFRREW